MHRSGRGLVCDLCGRRRRVGLGWQVGGDGLRGGRSRSRLLAGLLSHQSGPVPDFDRTNLRASRQTGGADLHAGAVARSGAVGDDWRARIESMLTLLPDERTWLLSLIHI